jgi:hypothetical protein
MGFGLLWEMKKFLIRRRGMTLVSRSKTSRFGFGIEMLVLSKWCGIFRRRGGGRFLMWEWWEFLLSA